MRDNGGGFLKLNQNADQNDIDGLVEPDRCESNRMTTSIKTSAPVPGALSTLQLQIFSQEVFSQGVIGLY